MNDILGFCIFSNFLHSNSCKLKESYDVIGTDGTATARSVNYRNLPYLLNTVISLHLDKYVVDLPVSLPRPRKNTGICFGDRNLCWSATNGLS